MLGCVKWKFSDRSACTTVRPTALTFCSRLPYFRELGGSLRMRVVQVRRFKFYATSPPSPPPRPQFFLSCSLPCSHCQLPTQLDKISSHFSTNVSCHVCGQRRPNLDCVQPPLTILRTPTSPLTFSRITRSRGAPESSKDCISKSKQERRYTVMKG